MTKSNIEQIEDAHTAYCEHCGELFSLHNDDHELHDVDCPLCGGTNALIWMASCVGWIPSGMMTESYDIDMFLLSAAGAGSLKEVEIALSRGADIHYLNDCVLRRAVEWGQFEVVRYLVSMGADIKKSRAIEIAREQRLTDTVEYLEGCLSLEADIAPGEVSINHPGDAEEIPDDHCTKCNCPLIVQESKETGFCEGCRQKHPPYIL